MISRKDSTMLQTLAVLLGLLLFSLTSLCVAETKDLSNVPVVKSGDALVYHDGQLVNSRLITFIQSEHSSFMVGVIAPLRILASWVASNLSSRPVGYGLELFEFMDVTWAKGTLPYRLGFVLGIPFLIIVLMGIMTFVDRIGKESKSQG